MYFCTIAPHFSPVGGQRVAVQSGQFAQGEDSMSSLFDLRGRVALVTGGNGGIGLGMARGLANAGASVVVAARNADKSNAAVRELQALGADALAVSVDVADEKSVDAMVGETVAWRARLDILVHNAGM